MGNKVLYSSTFFRQFFLNAADENAILVAFDSRSASSTRSLSACVWLRKIICLFHTMHGGAHFSQHTASIVAVQQACQRTTIARPVDMQVVRLELSPCPFRDYAADYVGCACKARRTPSGSRAITVR